MRTERKVSNLMRIICMSGCLGIVACQTTRLPTATKSADNSAMIVQVSDDQRSLMWSDANSNKLQNKNTASISHRASTDTALLQMHAELALLGHLTRAASENAKSILRTDIRNIRAMKTLIKAALMERKAHESLTMIETALSLAPQDAELFSLQGLAQSQLDHPLYAKALWSKALSLDPLHIPTLMNMGVMLFQNGHSGKAGAHFDKVLAIVPQHLDAQVGRALVMSAQGQTDSAVEALEMVLKKTGDNALILENLAVIARDRLKDYKKASTYVERSLALSKSDRRSLETAVGMKQELRKLMSGQDKHLSDESLREMAATGSGQGSQATEQSAIDSNSNSTSELFKMEESLK
jgi:tetratricopeptide (TPR) repeat protein